MHINEIPQEHLDKMAAATLATFDHFEKYKWCDCRAADLWRGLDIPDDELYEFLIKAMSVRLPTNQ